MEIIRDFNNELLSRRELIGRFTSDSNPGYDNLKKKILDKYKVNVEYIAVKFLKGKFGSDSFYFEVFIYNSLEDMQVIEPKKKLKGESK